MPETIGAVVKAGDLAKVVHGSGLGARPRAEGAEHAIAIHEYALASFGIEVVVAAADFAAVIDGYEQEIFACDLREVNDRAAGPQELGRVLLGLAPPSALA